MPKELFCGDVCDATTSIKPTEESNFTSGGSPPWQPLELAAQSTKCLHMQNKPQTLLSHKIAQAHARDVVFCLNETANKTAWEGRIVGRVSEFWSQQRANDPCTWMLIACL